MVYPKMAFPIAIDSDVRERINAGVAPNELVELENTLAVLIAVRSHLPTVLLNAVASVKMFAKPLVVTVPVFQPPMY
jgi:hypothetical protein